MITPVWRPGAKQLRQFGVISLFGFTAMGLVFWRSAGALWLATVFAAFGVLVCIVGLIRPQRIHPVYATLLAISLPIGWLVSGVLLRLVFFGVVTPIGLLFRILGRDALTLHRPPGDSYWRDHKPQDDAASYLRQS
jgi:Saxitoxin biosynthesis operon protein SxtJ